MIRYRRKYTNTNYFDLSRLKAEKVLLCKYGLRNKRQLRQAHGFVQKYQRVLRTYGTDNPITNSVVDKLTKLGVINGDPLEVVDLTSQKFLERRLQTRVALDRNISLNCARQMIVHGHVKVNDVKKHYPSYLIREGSIISYN